MWWIKKKKKCKCPCHYRSVGFLNPPDVHCPECPKFNRAANAVRLLSPQHQRSKLIHKIDDIVSLIIRIKAEWTCFVCHRTYPPVLSMRTGLPAQNLMTHSHYFNRGKFGTRWDIDNGDAACIFCHQKIENNKREEVGGFDYTKYMIEKLGEQKFEMLRIKSEMRGGYSIVDLELLLKDWQNRLKTTMQLYEYN